MLDENLIRTQLIEYTQKTGIKYCYIAKGLNIENTKLSRFKNKKRKLFLNELYRLQEYLNK
ncbi:hypothetical protein N452_14650 [Clostridium botulinum A2 117]|uniref:hypothetical protein n=1 Tax=Clostridium botulinum TaxID=1491 RepID=UPI0007E05826|nr:hypothetical protein [Clostridium botulinum]KEI79758.1 hypothetical protein N452_14650 [Clostridium botulinum A2 117]MBN3416842.1 hypothetical protein [Clostridium botulinum]MBN3443333.1 hypothetical protein [Clostridium botulinum]MBY6806939.1 hypothetical protein [Clostridium botulinum]